MPDSRPTLLLSVDFEDWHQLVRRRVGAANWQEPGPALARQTDAMLALFDELNARATFFVLGMAARAHPELLQRIVAAGHEIGCHGDAHLPVHAQSPQEFAADLRAARATIEQLTGRTPVGYRAPAFSITQQFGLGLRSARSTRGSRTTRASTTRRRSAIARCRRPRPRTASTSTSAPQERTVGVPGGRMARRAGGRYPNPGRRRVLLAGAADPRRAPGPDRGRRARRAVPASRTSSTPSRCARYLPTARHSRPEGARALARGPAKRRPPARPRRPQERSPADSS